MDALGLRATGGASWCQNLPRTSKNMATSPMVLRFPRRWVIGDPAVMLKVGKVFRDPRPYVWHESWERHRTWEGGVAILRHTRAIHGVAIGQARKWVTSQGVINCHGPFQYSEFAAEPAIHQVCFRAWEGSIAEP